MFKSCVVYADNREIERWNYAENSFLNPVDVFCRIELVKKATVVEAWTGQCNGVVEVDLLSRLLSMEAEELVYGFYGPDLDLKQLAKICPPIEERKDLSVGIMIRSEKLKSDREIRDQLQGPIQPYKIDFDAGDISIYFDVKSFTKEFEVILVGFLGLLSRYVENNDEQDSYLSIFGIGDSPLDIQSITIHRPLMKVLTDMNMYVEVSF